MIAFLVCIGFYILIGITFWKLDMLKKKYLELIFMWIMIFGIVSLCQPWIFFLYHYGFAILLTGVLGYTVSVHMK